MLSVIVPMMNEAENARLTTERIVQFLGQHSISFELLLIDDGSVDQTQSIIADLANEHPNVHAYYHTQNYGRGRALRTGFEHASGRFVVTVDADLSYNESHLLEILNALNSSPYPDIVLGSAYMHGGSVKQVPLLRKLISRWGNRVLSFAFHGKYKTTTCVLRGYRRKVLDRLDLDSNGKELHLEILAKAEDQGFDIKEIPAHLVGRKRGKSKKRLLSTSGSHFFFSISERPTIFFGLGGLLFILFGLIIGSYLIYLWQTSTLNPTRPLVSLMIILLLSGFTLFLFGILGLELRYLRKEIHNTRARLANLDRKLFPPSSDVNNSTD